MKSKLLFYSMLPAIVAFAALSSLASDAQHTEHAGHVTEDNGIQLRAATNPVTNTVRRIYDRRAKDLVAAANLMPAEKYNYKPTDDQISFGHIVAHIVGSNNTLCSRLGAAEAPKDQVNETDSKDKLIEAMKKSFDYCGVQLAKVDDAQLSQEMVVNDRKIVKAAVVVGLPADWADHYGQMAMYLRLNGILPPTAQPKKQ